MAGGLNKNIRLLKNQENLTTIGSPLVYVADKDDNRRLLNHSCAIWYVHAENVSSVATLTVTIMNRLFVGTVNPGTKTIICLSEPHGAAEGQTEAYAVGFSLTTDGEFNSNNASKARIHAGYQIEVAMTGGGGTADISIEAHYGEESGG